MTYRWKNSIEWAKDNVRIGSFNFNPSDRPWFHTPFNQLCSELGAHVILLGPAQTGKNLHTSIQLAWHIAEDPMNILAYSTQNKEAKTLASTKIDPLLEQTKAVQRVQWHDVDKRGSKETKTLPTMYLELLGADVLENRNSKSGDLIIRDESWQYEPGVIAETTDRGQGAKWRLRMLDLSTGPTAGSELDTLFNASSMHEWRLVCPLCKQPFIPYWEHDDGISGMRWDDDCRDNNARWLPNKVQASAHYVCPNCKGKIKHTESLLRWMNDAKNGAGYHQTNKDPKAKLYGYRFNSVAVDSWGKLAYEFTTAHNAMYSGVTELMENFRRKRLCLRFDAARILPSKLVDFKGGYMMGDEWTEEKKDEYGKPWRFMTVDVQQDHFWVVIRAWAESGESRLIWFGRVPSEAELPDVADRYNVLRADWKIRMFCSGGQRVGFFNMANSRVFMDCAYSPDGIVPRICAKHGFHMFNALSPKAFKNAKGIYMPFSEPILRNPTIGTYAGSQDRKVQEWHFASKALKDRLDTLRRIKNAKDKPVWTVADDAPQEYMDQIEGEVKTRVTNAKTGGFSYEWKQVGENHAFDMESAQIALSCMANIVSVDIPADDQQT